MENEIQIFNNTEFGSVRTLTINDEPWFVGKDVASALGYSNPRDALAKRVDTDDKGVANCDTLGGGQDMTIINESGLYSLILSSKLPKAKEFKRWVTSEVLPSIRKNGGYISGQENMTDEEVIANALVLANNVLAARDKRIKALETENKQLTEQNEEMLPKSRYFDAIVDKALLTSFTNTAKELGIKPRAFITYLLNNKYIFRNNAGTLLPYEKNKTNGLFAVKEFVSSRNNHAGIQTYVTPKGRQTFQMLLSVPGALDSVTTAAEEDQAV